ncbi:MAG: TetR/AcrR family transcriptional regulator [Gemmatimonadota bacterium]
MGIPERKEREFLRREQEILDVALALFRRDDWQSVTMEEIAQSAEIGKGTVYKHFPSKEDIYARLALDFNSRLLERLRGINPEMGVLDRLRAIIRAFWEFHLQSQDYHRLVQYCGREDLRRNITEETRDTIRALDQEFNVLVTSLVQEGIEGGLFPGHKPVGILLFGPQAALFGAIHMVWSGCLASGDPEEYLAEITEFIISGLTHPEITRENSQRRAIGSSQPD